MIFPSNSLPLQNTYAVLGLLLGHPSNQPTLIHNCPRHTVTWDFSSIDIYIFSVQFLFCLYVLCITAYYYHIRVHTCINGTSLLWSANWGLSVWVICRFIHIGQSIFLENISTTYLLGTTKIHFCIFISFVINFCH